MKNWESKIVSQLSRIYKICALLVTVVLILLLYPQRQTIRYDYTAGSVWNDSDLYAPFDFVVQSSQDEREQQLAIAKSQSLLYYYIDSSAAPMARQRLADYSQSHNLTPQKQRTLHKTLDSIYRIGFLEVTPDYGDMEAHTLVLLTGNTGSECKASDFVLPDDITNDLLLDSILVPNVRFDDTRTKLELDSWLSQTAFTSTMVKKGQLIVNKGEVVTAETAEIISSLDQERNRQLKQQYSTVGYYAGNFMLCLIALLAVYMFLKITRHKILEDNKQLTFVMVTIVIMVATTALVREVNEDWILMVPLCIAPILMRVFFDMRVALYLHLATIVIIANMVPNSYEFIFYQLIAGIMSIISVRKFEKRSSFFFVSLVIFVTYSLIYTCGVLSQFTTIQSINPARYVVFFINALLTLLAYPLIYLVEHIFGMVTDLTLLEISSTNTPALRELSRKAPGTFQHSMQVANISEDLVSEIGGNALLARVGALYHDIGKISAPLYYTENQNNGYNPHDELSYEDSARIITQHVKDGIDLARKYRLPGCVIDFIRTHHGTTYTGYFYAKQKEAHPGEPIDTSAFRYAGPTPFSRETAVVMLVDSVEAACKSMKFHDKETFDNLIDNIVNSKVEQRQLNNCDLTFSDLTKIKQMLKDKMLSIYHVRIAYPVSDDNEKQTENK